MDFSNFGGGNNSETIEDHVCEVIVVDFKSKKAIFTCKATNGEISEADQKALNKAQNSLQKPEKVKKIA